MKLEIFKPEDLDEDEYYKDTRNIPFVEWACIKANNKLNEWLKENGKVVYGSPEAVNGTPLAEVWYTYSSGGHGSKALLIFIEPIEKSMQEERSNKEQEIIEEAKQKLMEIYGNGFLFANAFQKFIQQQDSKPICTHPKEKVKQNFSDGFQCECGARVEPLSFGEVK